MKVALGLLLAIIVLIILASQALAGDGALDIQSPMHVVEVLRRSQAEYGLVHGQQGVTFVNRPAPDAAIQYSLSPVETTVGQGFIGGTGGLRPGDKKNFPTYVSGNKFNGVYTGNYALRYERNDTWETSAVVRYTLVLIGAHPPTFTPPTLAETSRTVGVALQPAPGEAHAWFAHGLPSNTPLSCPNGFICTRMTDGANLVVQSGPSSARGNGITVRWIPDMDYFTFAECNVFESEAALAARSQPPYPARLQSKVTYSADCTAVVGPTP